MKIKNMFHFIHLEITFYSFLSLHIQFAFFHYFTRISIGNVLILTRFFSIFEFYAIYSLVRLFCSVCDMSNYTILMI